MRDLQAERYGDIEKQLRRWYLEDGKTLDEIGALLGKRRSTVMRWMERLNIPRRTARWQLPEQTAPEETAAVA